MVTTAPLKYTDELAEILRETLVLDPDVMEALAEMGDRVFNASIEDLAESAGVDHSVGFAIFTIVERHKAGQGIARVDEPTLFPEQPPYLTSRMMHSPPHAGEYDSHNAGQFWTAEDGKMYRWDGKRSSRFPWGDRHRIVSVPHDSIEIGREVVLIPMRNEAWPDETRALVLSGAAQYFHQGYGCWIGAGGKPLADIPTKRRALILSAQQQRDKGLQVAF
jgi:hypothetical protein